MLAYTIGVILLLLAAVFFILGACRQPVKPGQARKKKGKPGKRGKSRNPARLAVNAQRLKSRYAAGRKINLPKRKLSKGIAAIAPVIRFFAVKEKSAQPDKSCQHENYHAAAMPICLSGLRKGPLEARKLKMWIKERVNNKTRSEGQNNVVTPVVTHVVTPPILSGGQFGLRQLQPP